MKAKCPAGTAVLSGGGSANGPFKSQRLVSSAPFDAGDPGVVTDDGWRVAVDNVSKHDHKAKLVASRYPPVAGPGSWITEIDNLSEHKASGKTFVICHA